MKQRQSNEGLLLKSVIAGLAVLLIQGSFGTVTERFQESRNPQPLLQPQIQQQVQILQSQLRSQTSGIQHAVPVLEREPQTQAWSELPRRQSWVF
ncbi:MULTISPECIES: hypothetical protein [Pseudomonas]|jgi:hypothetical protein|uniref:hypothetical protein n=1 Tax=Pseudomonas TaxID=286 RepID=UPI000BABEBB9|nr:MULTISPECIES: hypothetical protein [Pseudomonas]MBU3058681.1 hypothetical protein [Pseudomonas indica]PAU56428.1 hypothetical protein BZL42_16735 [Pseudomonas indica]PAU64934.1 hypothetical protein BZL41_08600 [Pseudomonas sp. PIC25]